MTTAIEIRDLRYRYPDGTEALRGVSFSVDEGHCVGLIGPNGAGKSTLLLHLNGLLPEKLDGQSTVLIAGKPITTDSAMAVRRQVGFLFQDPNDQIFCPTVFEDVAFGPQQFGLAPEEVRSRVAKALSQVALAGFETRSPHHLSGGEKRRVCLAGVLACEPTVLVLDEPTSNLDPRGRRELRELLRSIPITKIIATHDLEFVVELCSRVVVLSKGQIVADGETAKIMLDESLMLQYDLETPHILRHGHPHFPTGE